MPIHERLKKIRLSYGWSQEVMAEKIGYSKNGYAKIERGEAELNFSKLEHIAERLGVSVDELLSRDSNVFNLGESFNQGSVGYNIVLSETQCAHELEKAKLEIEYLKQQNADLRAMINLLKSDGK